MQDIDEYIFSDIGVCDLTTSLMAGVINLRQSAILRIKTREDLVLSGVEFADKIAKKLDCEILSDSKNGDKFSANSEIYALVGSFEDIHKAWKITQNLFEYSCKISTYTNQMVEKIRAINSKCNLAITRKSFPFAREFCVKAALAGGAVIHRLGLFDTILFFDNHIGAFGGFDKFCENLGEFRAKMAEKKIMVEVDNLGNLQKLLNLGVDVIMADKFGIDDLQKAVILRNEISPRTVICAAGGINLQNCESFAKTGIDAIVTSAVFTKGVCDIGAKVELV